jgi:hypothetical protein
VAIVLQRLITAFAAYFVTDNWLELAVRFVTRERGVREIKDAMSRQVLAGLEAAGIPIASATYEIVGLPPIRLVDAAGEAKTPKP